MLLIPTANLPGLFTAWRNLINGKILDLLQQCRCRAGASSSVPTPEDPGPGQKNAHRVNRCALP